MNIGTQILKIRKEKGLTQEEFGKIFHVTRQTVSNWENEKSYPDLQILIDISNRFDISLDAGKQKTVSVRCVKIPGDGSLIIRRDMKNRMYI